MSVLTQSMRQVFKGVSWQSKYIKPITFVLDAPDWAMRKAKGLDYLPKYSIRVRSDGVTSQLGGGKFDYFGGVTAQLLANLAELTPTSKVLEIGCGCGRSFGFTTNENVRKGGYTGVDIDRPSIAAAQANKLLQENGFAFQHIDVKNAMYNPQGKEDSTAYTFPFEDESVDVIFLISVFTHMLREDVTHYINEISRLLKPGGRCLMSTFLIDYGYEGKGVSFPYERDGYRLHDEAMPEKIVGYPKRFFDQSFAAVNMSLRTQALGDWRDFAIDEPLVDFGQDMLVFEKDRVFEKEK